MRQATRSLEQPSAQAEWQDEGFRRQPEASFGMPPYIYLIYAAYDSLYMPPMTHTTMFRLAFDPYHNIPPRLL